MPVGRRTTRRSAAADFRFSKAFCGEECNFVPCEDGFVYGHFETIKGQRDRQVRIERLGAGLADDYVDGIDIVWTAPTRGNDPRTVVGWFRNARLYRHRQEFGEDFPSDRHRRDDISSFRVRARSDDVFLLSVNQRRFNLERGPGWSGQASWWYAEDTADRDAAEFVATVRTLMDTGRIAPVARRSRNRNAGRKRRAGAAAGHPYQRYLRAYEMTVHPRHDGLQKRFVAHLAGRHRGVDFPSCARDDLRYVVKGKACVMVEVKPTEASTVRFAIRTAIGQLLDYRQDQGWTGPQLILVETEVTRADDLRLAFDNGFGLAWPSGRGFEVVWPDGRRGC
ncbi:MAG: hypothetical protein JO013_02100 [Alphaproteobacteria bacterium]|nr:hypothetical protein [Alphaproteobacteria bacterium]